MRPRELSMLFVWRHQIISNINIKHQTSNIKWATRRKTIARVVCRASLAGALRLHSQRKPRPRGCLAIFVWCGCGGGSTMDGLTFQNFLPNFQISKLKLPKNWKVTAPKFSGLTTYAPNFENASEGSKIAAVSCCLDSKMLEIWREKKVLRLKRP